MDELHLHTVCRSAKCPNMFECFSKHTATFLILGSACTRNCTFCNIEHGHAPSPDPDEPVRVAQAAQRLGLAHVVVTSVTRDDLPDGGAAHFAATIHAIRAALPHCTVEVLIPDFQGSMAALDTVLSAGPHVLNHNVETAPALYDHIRPQADYARSLELLTRINARGYTSKSGLMVGLGETDGHVRGVLDDLAAIDCHIVTIGQYMRPSRRHLPVARYVHPETFAAYASYGTEQGIARIFSAPLVRSSYNAAAFVEHTPDAL